MAKQTDIFIKDEGNFLTVILQSKKANKIMKADKVYQQNKDSFYGEEIIKFDIQTDQQSQILIWAVSHALTIGGDVSMTIN